MAVSGLLSFSINSYDFFNNSMLTFNIAFLLLLTMSVFLKCLHVDIPMFSLFRILYSTHCLFDQLI